MRGHDGYTEARVEGHGSEVTSKQRTYSEQDYVLDVGFDII